tara:strand:- start:134 stop:505 length:372 start_codon:yes stop_codon:yes gene_type:complete
MNDKKKNKIETKINRLDSLQAAYVMAICAAKADGKVEEAEIEDIHSICELLGHDEALNDAYSYVELFQENDDAINLAITALEKSPPVASLAAIMLMESVLAQNGLNKEENEFYEKVLQRVSSD